MQISLTLFIIALSITAFIAFFVGCTISDFVRSRAESRKLYIVDDSQHGEAVRVFCDEGLIATFPRHTAHKLKVMFNALGINATIEPQPPRIDTRYLKG